MKSQKRGSISPKCKTLLEDIGIIDKADECLRHLVLKTGLGDVSNEEFVEALNNKASDDEAIIYFTVDGYEVDESDSSAHYKLFNTGYVTTTGSPIYFSFYRNGSRWYGAFVVTLSEFKDMADKYYREQVQRATGGLVTISDRRETPFEKSVSSKVPNNISAEAISDALRVSSGNKAWQDVITYVRVMCSTPTWVFDSTDRLMSYLRAIEARVQGILKLVDNGGKLPEEYIRLSEDKKYAYINTGIQSKLSKPIFVAAELVEKEYSFNNVVVIRCRDMLAELGFSYASASAKPKKLSFFKENELPLFMKDILDVDIENPKSIIHCMVDNIERLPAYVQAMTEEERTDYYFRKLQLSFERQSVDSFYFKPFYCIKNDSIEYIVPIYENDDVTAKVEFGFILGVSPNGFWGIYTVLTAEQCKGSVQVLQPFLNFNI